MRYKEKIFRVLDIFKDLCEKRNLDKKDKLDWKLQNDN